MSHPMIKVEHLSKQYKIGVDRTYKTLQDSITGAFKSPLNLFRHSNDNNTFWALKDVSFEVEEGEVVGIIGRNGAGKSTLLKILSRITEPTEGRITMHGRVASLLEVGTGFHPELTGRENVYLNGSILGMTKREIDAKFDEIVKFAEIEKFLDTPVKRYSSGMYVRLAFAVAAHLEPEILLVDEVLAVGDAAFQKKCLGKMKDVSSKEGRTVLFVSHNMGAISNLCRTCILFEKGIVVEIGETAHVVSKYMMSVYDNSAKINFPIQKAKRGQITSVSLINYLGKNTSSFPVNESPTIEISYVLRENISGLHVACIISSSEGNTLFATADTDTNPELFGVRLAGTYTTRVKLPEGLLNVGTYNVAIGLGIPSIESLDRQDAVSFTLADTGDFGSMKEGRRRSGLILLKLQWEYS
ncbi:MAG: ABC transporter ATP-binding protein [Candidatus Methanoperedens sp.]|nr:ABC transporter ATP-binding protein [Candidatus Methanoperedens sp.]